MPKHWMDQDEHVDRMFASRDKEIAGLKAELDQCRGLLRQNVEAVGSLKARRAEAERDAERYRWLRDVHGSHIFATRMVGGATIPRYVGQALDTLIDQARDCDAGARQRPDDHTDA